MSRPYDGKNKRRNQTMKTYEFPTTGSVNGAVTTKTLAAPTNIRMKGMLEVLGFKSFREMFSPEKIVEGLVAKLDLVIDEKKMEDTLRYCLVEGCEDVDLAQMDLRLFDGMVQDFFEQRAANMTERMKSSIAG
jgi:hypothetical protein